METTLKKVKEIRTYVYEVRVKTGHIVIVEIAFVDGKLDNVCAREEGLHSIAEIWRLRGEVVRLVERCTQREECEKEAREANVLSGVTKDFKPGVVHECVGDCCGGSDNYPGKVTTSERQEMPGCAPPVGCSGSKDFFEKAKGKANDRQKPKN
jgi:hypothetical protein